MNRNPKVNNWATVEFDAWKRNDMTRQERKGQLSRAKPRRKVGSDEATSCVNYEFLRGVVKYYSKVDIYDTGDV